MPNQGDALIPDSAQERQRRHRVDQAFAELVGRAIVQPRNRESALGHLQPSRGYSIEGPSNPPIAPLTHSTARPFSGAECITSGIAPRVVAIVILRAPAISSPRLNPGDSKRQPFVQDYP